MGTKSKGRKYRKVVSRVDDEHDTLECGHVVTIHPANTTRLAYERLCDQCDGPESSLDDIRRTAASSGDSEGK